MGCRAAGNGASLVARLDAGVVAEPAHASGARHSPEAIIDPLERMHQGWPHRNRTSVQSPGRQAMPPDVGLGEWTNRGAGEATAPIIVHVGSKLVTGKPVDLVFFDAVED